MNKSNLYHIGNQPSWGNDHISIRPDTRGEGEREQRVEDEGKGEEGGGERFNVRWFSAQVSNFLKRKKGHN